MTEYEEEQEIADIGYERFKRERDRKLEEEAERTEGVKALEANIERNKKKKKRVEKQKAKDNEDLKRRINRRK